MNIQAPNPMTVDEYLAWAKDRPGRYELIDGTVRQMSPETIRHANEKHAATVALRAAVKRSGVAAFVVPDGATVRISEHKSFEPDALVYMAPQQDSESIEVLNPVIVVEAASPSTHKYDAGFKLEGYMRLPSVHHILLVHGTTNSIVHHRRISASEFRATTVSDGILKLDPPGLEVPVADFFAVD